MKRNSSSRGRPKPKFVNVEQGNAAMTFSEIARELGFRDPENHGRKAVFVIYRRGMQKLARKPGMLRQLQEISEARIKCCNQ